MWGIFWSINFDHFKLDLKNLFAHFKKLSADTILHGRLYLNLSIGFDKKIGKKVEQFRNRVSDDLFMVTLKKILNIEKTSSS